MLPGWISAASASPNAVLFLLPPMLSLLPHDESSHQSKIKFVQTLYITLHSLITFTLHSLILMLSWESHLISLVVPHLCK